MDGIHSYVHFVLANLVFLHCRLLPVQKGNKVGEGVLWGTSQTCSIICLVKLLSIAWNVFN